MVLFCGKWGCQSQSLRESQCVLWLIRYFKPWRCLGLNIAEILLINDGNSQIIFQNVKHYIITVAWVSLYSLVSSLSHRSSLPPYTLNPVTTYSSCLVRYVQFLIFPSYSTWFSHYSRHKTWLTVSSWTRNGVMLRIRVCGTLSCTII